MIFGPSGEYLLFKCVCVILAVFSPLYRNRECEDAHVSVSAGSFCVVDKNPLVTACVQ